MGRALWALRQQSPKFLVDSSPITATTDLLAALDQSDEGRQLHTALDEFLTACGHRGNHWGLHYRIWIEDPAPVLAALRGAATDPQIAFAAQAAKRKQALTRRARAATKLSAKSASASKNC